MKKIIRNPVVIITCIILISILFSVMLYKSFCKLEQTVDWNALNAIASFIMAIITAAAVYVAIYIPKEDRIIASKIELFEYRFQLFYTFEEIFVSQYTQGDDGKINPGEHENFSRINFLINDSDAKKVIDLFNSVVKKREEKDDGEYLYEDIVPELKELIEIFKKYIDLRDYGIFERD
jgi:hypothetical protein